MRGPGSQETEKSGKDECEMVKGVHVLGALCACLAWVGVVAQPHAAAECSTLLLLHFDEGSGSKANDSSGSGNNGLITGAQWVDGRFGKALSFDGEDDFVDCGHNAVFDFGDKTDFTIECWINVNPAAPKRYHQIITKKLRGDAAEPGFQLCLDTGFHPRATIADGFNSVNLMAAPTLNDGKWHHLALTADRDGEALLYVDAKPEARASMKDIIDVTNTERNLRIGDREYDNDFAGMIDEVRISNCARTEFSLTKSY